MSIKDKIKQYGWKNSLKRFIKYLLRHVGIHYESYWFIVNQLSQREIKLKMEKYDYSDVVKLKYEDFKKGDPKIFNAKKLKLIQTRFEKGDYWGYGMLDNNKLIYSCWITTEAIHLPTNFYETLPLSQNEGFIEDSYCNINYRGKGLHSKMNLYRLLKLHQLGRNRIIGIVLVDNVPAIRSQIKSGFVIEKKIKFLKIFSKTYIIKKKVL